MHYRVLIQVGPSTDGIENNLALLSSNALLALKNYALILAKEREMAKLTSYAKDGTLSHVEWFGTWDLGEGKPEGAA